MKQDETDPTGDLDAGWDEGDEPAESGRSVTRPSDAPASAVASTAVASTAVEGSAAQAGASTAAPHTAAIPEEDELDGGWDDADEEPASDEVAHALRTEPTTARSGDTDASEEPSGPRRASFKKAHRQLRLKNQEHARRSKKTHKAERKAQRREEARQSRQRREEEARLARELKARREQEKKARAKKAESPKAAQHKKSLERARQQPEPVTARSEAESRARPASRAPGGARKKRLQVNPRARRQERVRLATIVLVGLVIVALVAWRLAAS